MSWAAVAGAGVSLVGGMLGGSNDDASEAALQRQQWLDEQQIGIQRDTLGFAKEQYYDHKGKFDPLFDDIRGMMDDVEPDYGAIAGDINSSFDSARGMEERNERRYGIKPTDGAARQSQRQYGIQRAAAHVGARSKAREGAKDKRYGRYADLYNSGMGIGSSNASMVTSAMNGLGQTYGAQAGRAGQTAQMYDNRAMQDAQGWGQMAGSIDWGGLWNSAKGWFSGGNGTSQGGYTDSDVRLKENIEFLGLRDGIRIYRWDWNDLARARGVTAPSVGVLAQEHMDSGFVRERDGFLQVDYRGLFAAQAARQTGEMA